ncbi:hypothetical protein EB118_10860 [bacterium]|nr:hypothetical protein [bacterium]
MGAQQSTSRSEQNITNKAITETLMTSSTNCGSKSSQVQTMLFKDIKAIGCNVDFSNISQDAKVEVDLTCAQDNQNSAKLMQDFSNNLKSEVESKTKGFAVGYQSSQSDNISNITNEIVTKTNMTNIANCVAQNMQQQTQEYGGWRFVCQDPKQVISIKNISQNLVGKVAGECFQKNSNASDVSQKLDNTLTSSTKATTEGLSLDFGLGEMFKNIIGIIIAVVVLSVVVSLLSSTLPIILKIASSAGGGGGGRGGPQYNYPPPPSYEPQSYEQQ